MNLEQSPSKLKTTQSILSTLYERALQSTHQENQLPPQDPHEFDPMPLPSNPREKLTASLKKEKERINRGHQYSQSAFMERTHLKTESEEPSHQHSQHCCFYSNGIIKGKLEKAHQNQLLLNTYKEQVQFLKKMMLMQSEEIEKLRRMLRCQEDKSIFFARELPQPNCQEQAQIPKKRNQTRKNSMKTDKKVRRN